MRPVPTDHASKQPSCAGIDGCPKGWVVASRSGVEVVRTLDDVLGRFDVIGIDMPIGLPETATRAADLAARRFISPRGSCVFPTTPRVIAFIADYADANRALRERFGKGLTQQSFRLGARLRHLDALMSPGLEHRVIEVHPECSFRALAGRTLSSKHGAVGVAERRDLLTQTFGPLPPTPPGSKQHDLLDAFAALWSAERFAAGVHLTLPGDIVERDGRGLHMRIVV